MSNERLQNQIKLREFKLKALLDATKAINNNLSTEALIAQYREVAQTQLSIPRLVLFTFREGTWECLLQYGLPPGKALPNVEADLLSYTEITIVQSKTIAALSDFDVVIPVFHKERPLSYLLIGDLEDESMQVSPIIKHMRFLQTLTNIISVAIENKNLFQRTLEQERINTELALAAEMQALLVGTGVRTYPHFEVATYYKPHFQVGGDFCDFIEFNEDESFFCVADVSGKGVSAAFLMANVQAQLRALLEHTNWTLEGLAHELNRKVMSLVKGDRFVTLFMGYFHRPTRRLQYLNAGHNPPVLYSNGEIHYLKEGTVGIGMLHDLPFINHGEIKLGYDAAIVAYTDGIIETENDAQEEFGYERLGHCLERYSKHDSLIETLVTDIVQAAEAHRSSNPYTDDITLLCCRFR